ncbi:4745_t:CDS:2 [Cetraspora pellucida]|uniref:4745_t:CDS:1 n=1 Tax=Cetraspora pellucida TaxID=1433469 RepID=A0A9N9F6Y6_9GLOM|nr:4745_t:CDS:2 [Cetraspora pellucida]
MAMKKYVIHLDKSSEQEKTQDILLDESNTITNEKTLAIVSKHFANNVPVIRYIGMISLNKTTVEAILADLELFCTAKGLDLTRLIHFDSDGASNITATEDASKGLQYFSDYTAVVKGIYSYCITTEFIGSPRNLPQLGTQLLNYMTTNRISTPKLPLFVAQYATNIITNPHEISTKRQALNNFGKDKIIFLGNYYDKEIENEYSILTPKFDKTKLFEEWNLVKHFILKFKNFLPLSNSYIERIFSHQNMIKTKLRNQMVIPTLNNYLLISLNGPSIENFDLEQAYKH